MIELHNYTRIERPADVDFDSLMIYSAIECSEHELNAILGMPDMRKQRWIQRADSGELFVIERNQINDVAAWILGDFDSDTERAYGWLVNLIERYRLGRILIDIPDRLRADPCAALPAATDMGGVGRRIYYAVAYPAKLLRFDSKIHRNHYLELNDCAVAVSFVQARGMVDKLMFDTESWAIDPNANEFGAQVFRKRCKSDAIVKLLDSYPGKTLQ